VRVLHLELSDGPVTLHPFVTVIRGVSPEVRKELLDVFGAIPRGRAPVRGLLEAHGVLLDLTDESLAMLDLSADLDSIVRVADLPARGASRASALDDAEQRLVAARAELRAREAVLVAAAAARDDALAAVEVAEGAHGAAGPAMAEPVYEAPVDSQARLDALAAFDDARDAYEAAKSAHAELEAAASAAAARHREAMLALQAAEDALEATAELRDPAAAAVIDAARRRLVDAESAVASAADGEVPAAPATGSIERVREERFALEAALLALEPTDSLPVRVALRELRNSERDTLVPSPVALELADRWAIVETDLEQIDARAGDAPPGDEREQAGRRALAEARMAEAEAALDRAEAALHGTILDPDDVAELERVHEELLAARDLADKRFGGGKGEKRLEDAIEAEEQILQRLGYRTWADYRLGAPSAVVATRDQLADQVVSAQRALRDARLDFEREAAAIDTELVRAEALERRRRLREQAVDLLGEDPGDDVEGALRRFRVPVEDTGGHLQRLRAALDSAGLALDEDDLDEELLTTLAEGWLHEQTETEKHRAEIEAQLHEVDARLSGLQASARASAEGDPTEAAAAGLDEARAALAVAEARVAADHAATAQLDDLREAFELASVEERDSASAMVLADEQVLRAEATLRAAEEEMRKADLAVAAHERTHQAALVAAADRADFQARVAAAGADLPALEQALDQAWATVDRARDAHAEAGREVGLALSALESLRRAEDADDGVDPAAPQATASADDLEWYLLARLAAQRNLSFAGSVPLVLDDTLAGLDAASASAVLERLERMASTVQLVILTEDLTAASWAESAGPERALVVER
jgi:hypothetical protein